MQTWDTALCRQSDRQGTCPFSTEMALSCPVGSGMSRCVEHGCPAWACSLAFLSPGCCCPGGRAEVGKGDRPATVLKWVVVQSFVRLSFHCNKVVNDVSMRSIVGVSELMLAEMKLFSTSSMCLFHTACIGSFHSTVLYWFMTRVAQILPLPIAPTSWEKSGWRWEIGSNLAEFCMVYHRAWEDEFCSCNTWICREQLQRRRMWKLRAWSFLVPWSPWSLSKRILFGCWDCSCGSQVSPNQHL